MTCPRCGSSATVTVEIPGVYDGGLYRSCFACGHAWHRWPEGDWRRERANRYVRSDQ